MRHTEKFENLIQEIETSWNRELMIDEKKIFLKIYSKGYIDGAESFSEKLTLQSKPYLI